MPPRPETLNRRRPSTPPCMIRRSGSIRAGSAVSPVTQAKTATEREYCRDAMATVLPLLFDAEAIEPLGSVCGIGDELSSAVAVECLKRLPKGISEQALE